MKMKISVRDNYRMFIHSAGKSREIINDVNKSHAQEISDIIIF